MLTKVIDLLRQVNSGNIAPVSVVSFVQKCLFSDNLTYAFCLRTFRRMAQEVWFPM